MKQKSQNFPDTCSSNNTSLYKPHIVALNYSKKGEILARRNSSFLHQGDWNSFTACTLSVQSLSLKYYFICNLLLVLLWKSWFG
jgi:hypothetical protein